MLSYLRDPNLEELPAEQQAEAAQKPEQEYLTVAKHKNDVRKSTTMLCVLFIIGLICLGLMIKKSSPKAAVAKSSTDTEEIRIKEAIEQLLKDKVEMDGTMDEIVNKFNRFSNVFQVKVSELVKNPFQLESLVENLTNQDPQIDSKMIYEERIKQKAKNLKLYSTMQSQKGVCCMINNEILYEGDKIEDFIVKKIGNDNVQLEMQDVEIILKISK